jgi:hypothetical protein
MPNGGKILLKARPTPVQLADRIASPTPEGLELYIATEDLLLDPAYLADRIQSARPAPSFTFIVEGPIRSLDGAYFDVTQNTEANREVIRRLVNLGTKIGSPVAVIHAIAVRQVIAELHQSDHPLVLQMALPLLKYYASLCIEAGITPTIENVPPICMMREGSPAYSLLGVSYEDMSYLCNHTGGLQVTLDISHAQLYVNATQTDPTTVAPSFASIVELYRHPAAVCDWREYVRALDGLLCNAHISNARGVTGEGLACCDGDLDLADVARTLAKSCRFLVTETIEPDADRAVRMREVQQCLIKALAA